jgi:hypothetical protein
MYGGTPPKLDTASATNEMVNRNITLTLLQLLRDERQVVEIDPASHATSPGVPPTSMLFNLTAWPRSRTVTPTDEASWINACRIRSVGPADAGLPAWVGEPAGEFETPPPGFRRYLALVFSRLRELLAEGFECSVPGNLRRQVRPAAFVFIGGAVDVFKGVMPGVMEEFLRAAQARPAIPIYLLGGLGGATRVIAQALLDETTAPRPAALTQKHYQGRPARNGAEYDALLSELTKPEAQKVRRAFDDLWEIIKSRRGKGGLDNLFSNGLNHEENKRLLKTTNTTEAVSLIWQGMSRVFLLPARVAPGTKPRLPKKSTLPRGPRGK